MCAWQWCISFRVPCSEKMALQMKLIHFLQITMARSHRVVTGALSCTEFILISLRYKSLLSSTVQWVYKLNRVTEISHMFHFKIYTVQWIYKWTTVTFHTLNKQLLYHSWGNRQPLAMELLVSRLFHYLWALKICVFLEMVKSWPHSHVEWFIHCGVWRPK